MELWETCLLQSQACAELSFIHQGLALKRGTLVT
jgi:hypothetical protein